MTKSRDTFLLAFLETSGSLGRAWCRKVFWDRYGGRESRSSEKNMEESHLPKLGEEFGVTVDDIPGAKLVKNTAKRLSRSL